MRVQAKLICIYCRYFGFLTYDSLSKQKCKISLFVPSEIANVKKNNYSYNKLSYIQVDNLIILESKREAKIIKSNINVIRPK